MIVVIFFILVLASTSNQHPLPRSIPAITPYKLVYTTDSTTVTTGFVTISCHNSTTAEEVLLSDVLFWINRTNAQDPSLRSRTGITVTEVDQYRLKFALTRHLEGNYTCGKLISDNTVLENNQKTLVSLQTIIPMTDVCIVRNYTALAGDRIVLPCSIAVGALLQSYSVEWTKDNIKIAEAFNPQQIRKLNSKYDIDRSTYALIIDPVSVNDSSTDYRCNMFVENPITHDKQQLQYNPQPGSLDTSLSLSVSVTKSYNQDQANVTTVASNTTMWCTCTLQ